MSELKHDRITLAIEQLGVAIDLFLTKRSMAAALTLAGAAEEILGNALIAEGKNNALRQEYAIVRRLPWLFGSPCLQFKSFRNTKNHSKNAVKHMDVHGEKILYSDLESEAMNMIIRAITNYSNLGHIQTKPMKEFDNWFYANVIGIADAVYE